MSRRAHGTVDSGKPLAPMTWAQRLKRVFAIDIENCPNCRGKLRVIACIDDPPLIAKVLGHVRSRAPATATQARGPPADAQPALQLTSMAWAASPGFCSSYCRGGWFAGPTINPSHAKSVDFSAPCGPLRGGTTGRNRPAILARIGQ